MSGLREQLVAQLGRFDDEAFAALASRGLLRRAQKDLEKQDATVLEESAEALVMGFADHRISFDARGPGYASCSCRAGGVCQHILSAALSLKKAGLSGAGENSQNPQTVEAGQSSDAARASESQVSSPAAPSIEDLHSTLVKFTMAELGGYSGKAGYRWAFQFVNDLDFERSLQLSGDQYIIIGFNHPRITFRYMGGGLDNLIPDVQLSQINKLRVAAVLAYQKAKGVTIDAPEPSARAAVVEMNLGKDFSGPASQDLAQADSRSRLRWMTQQVITECIELGLSHLSRGIHERFLTLAVWAQGAEYYRLALLLRRMADHVELLLERAGSADERRLFDELTIAYGLVSALDDAARRGMAPSSLVGCARSRYEEAGTIELIGLGSHPWRAASGYVGLTMLFWSPADCSFLSYTDARPPLFQAGFNPFARYKAPGPWNGLSSPAMANGHRFTLSGAAINQVGRISGSESIMAIVSEQLTGRALAAMLKPFNHWANLLQMRGESRRSLLAEPNPMKDWVVLQPKAYGKPEFDSIRQTMIWPLYDAEDQQLNAELQFSEYTRQAIMRIEQVDYHALTPDTLLVARLRPGLADLVAEPLSLVRTDAGSGQNPVDALHFDEAQKSGQPKWLSKLLRGKAGAEAVDRGALPLVKVPPSLQELGQKLQQMAEKGVAGGMNDDQLHTFKALCKKMTEAGLSVFEEMIQKNDQFSILLVKANYLRLQYERLLDDTQESILS